MMRDQLCENVGGRFRSPDAMLNHSGLAVANRVTGDLSQIRPGELTLTGRLEIPVCLRTRPLVRS